MKTMIGIVVTLGICTASARAGGVDRSGQPIDILFEEGNVVELSFGHIRPRLTGTDTTVPPFTNSIGNVAGNFSIPGLALKLKLTEKFSLGFVFDEPYGTDIKYPGISAATALGGTSAEISSSAVTVAGRYKVTDNFSVHGGFRQQKLSADVALSGLAYGALSGYNASFDDDTATGYLVGVAYEVPEIALRLALTYNSEIVHNSATQERVGTTVVSAPSVTEIVTPESFKLSFRTGVAADTLVFGSVRYARYEDTVVSPTFFDANVDPATSGNSLVNIGNSIDYEIGVGRRFTEKLSGSVALGYQTAEDYANSPLDPKQQTRYVSLGASYQITDDVKLSGGLRYSMFNASNPVTAGVPRARFADNSATSVGLRMSYSF